MSDERILVLMEERVRALEEIRKEQERYRVTLASIGDAVIATDASANISFMNAVAENLTGWVFAEAAGRQLSDVFRIVHEQTRKPVENPALRALREGTVVGLANHTILISRDGSERPIEDSAAPIKYDATDPTGAVLVFRDATERRRFEDAQARLAAIVESSDDAIVSKSLDGIIQSWNAGAERLFGYTAKEAIGRPITLIIPPERLEEEPRILERLRRGERVDHYETIRLTKDQRRIDISLTISPVRNADGAVIAASKIARDITQRKRDEQALRESERLHRVLLSLAAATHPLTSPADIMAASARVLAEHLGVDRCAYAEVAEESVYIVTGDYAVNVGSIVGRWPVAAFGAEHLRMMRAGEPYVIDDAEADPRITAKDLLAFRATEIRAVICVPLLKDGRLTAAMAVHQRVPRGWTPAEIRLVTAVVGRCWEALGRASAERALAESRARLDYAARVSGIGFWYCDLPFDVLKWDDRVKKHFWLPTGAEVTIETFYERIHLEDREPTRRAIEYSMAAHTAYDTQYRTVDPSTGAWKWIRALGATTYGPDGKPIRFDGVTIDVTEQRRAEDELRDADRKKDDFIALLAHELRNPLAPIRNGLQVLRLAGDDRDIVGKAQAMMDRQLSHMVRLIDDLLDVSRISRNKMSLHRTQVGLNEIVNNAVETARPLIENAGHELDLILPQEPVVLDADLTRLAQVLSNLLTNSAKYTEPGGQIALSAEVHDNEVVMAVRDNGIGIPPAALPNIFDMFSQVERSANRSVGGLGVGLALVKKLVEMHGGIVAAESPGEGRGSTFTIHLPLTRSDPAPADARKMRR